MLHQALRKKQTLVPVAFLLTALALSACGGSNATTNQNAPVATATTKSSATAKASMTATVKASATSTKTATTTVKTATITVNGKSMAALTDSQGMPLYYFSSDSNLKSSCTAACTEQWHPAIAGDNTGMVSAPEQLSGRVEVVKTVHGNQLAYNGHLLYTYKGDTSPSEAKGDGVEGKWHVASVEMTNNARAHR